MVGDVCVLERLHFMSHYMCRNGISFKEVFVNLRCISDMKAKKENNAHIHTACELCCSKFKCLSSLWFDFRFTSIDWT